MPQLSHIGSYGQARPASDSGTIATPEWSVSRDLLRRAFNAYRRGIVRKPQTQGEQVSFASTRPQDWNTLEFHASLGLVPLSQRRLYRRAGKISYRAFLTAREGRLEDAQSQFEEAWSVLDRLDEGPGWWMALVALESNRAYLEYRLKDWARAEERLAAALDGSLVLERQFGLSMYQIHRIQLGHNLARMDWKRNRMYEAARLCGEAVAFLEGRISSPSYHHDWMPERVEWVPRSLVRAMSLQVAREAFTWISCKGSDRAWGTFLAPLLRVPTPENPRFLSKPVWIFAEAVGARLCGDLQTYFLGLEQALPVGPKTLKNTFYSMMVDLTRVCLESPDPFAAQVASVIIRDSYVWKAVPPAVVTALDHLNEQRESFLGTERFQSASRLASHAASSRVEAGAQPSLYGKEK